MEMNAFSNHDHVDIRKYVTLLFPRQKRYFILQSHGNCTVATFNSSGPAKTNP